MRTRNLLPALLLGVALAGLAASTVPAADSADAGKIKKLIEQLGADSYAERQAASEALGKIGAPALGALREAAKSTDAEVRKRASELLGKVEKLAENKKLLGPKMVHLVFKDTPLKAAVADFSKKSGYDLVLLDPDNKLKDVKVTLDTGKVTFWEAMGKFGDAAGVHDDDPNAGGPAGGIRPAGAVPVGPAAKGSIDSEEAKAPAPPKGPVRAGAALFVKDIHFGGDSGPRPRPGAMVGGWVPVQPGQFYLLPGKPAKAPADTTTAVRVRPADRKRYPLAVSDKEVGLVLQLALEPKVRWQGLAAAQIDKAIDDQGQSLRQAEEGRPDAPPAAAPGRGGARLLPAPPAVAGVMARIPASANGVYHFAPLRLKKGDKESKSLAELAGTITGQALTESEALLVVEGVLKAKGKEVKGKSGGEIKVTDVTNQPDGTTQIKFEFEMPDGVLPDTLLPAPAAPAPVGAASGARAVAETRPAAGGMMVPGRPGTFAPYGLRLVDDKGNVMLSTIQANWARGLGVGAAARKMEFHATYRPTKEAGDPAKLVFMARREVAVTVPFVLKGVELK
jgi:hypothetical protein